MKWTKAHTLQLSNKNKNNQPCKYGLTGTKATKIECKTFSISLMTSNWTKVLTPNVNIINKINFFKVYIVQWKFVILQRIIQILSQNLRSFYLLHKKLMMILLLNKI